MIHLIVEGILTSIMFIVQKIRRDPFNYISASDELLSWISKGRLMGMGHSIPSLVVTLIIAIKIMPLISEAYAEQLSENGTIVPVTVVLLLIPMLVLNGLFLEFMIERFHSAYREAKKQ